MKKDGEADKEDTRNIRDTETEFEFSEENSQEGFARSNMLDEIYFGAQISSISFYIYLSSYFLLEIYRNSEANRGIAKFADDLSNFSVVKQLIGHH